MESKFKTLTDLVRARSDWHFDPNVVETSHTLVARCWIPWMDEIKALISAAESDKEIFEIALGSRFGKNRHTEEEEMSAWGYPAEHVFHEYLNVDLKNAPFLQSLVDACGLLDADIDLVRMLPGQMIPWHCDMFDGYGDRTGSTTPPTRYLMTLCDWDWGQIVGVGNGVWSQWREGDVITWPHLMYHFASNAGRKPMLFLTVTGMASSESLHLSGLREIRL